MCPIQWKIGLLVILNGKKRAGKTIFRMAFCAVGADAVHRKFTLVIICMTGSTFIVRQRVGQVFGVAFAAVDGLVQADQREVRQIVVELICVDTEERFFIVAFCAVLPKLVFVNILVAGHTIVCLNAQLALKQFGQAEVHVVTIFTIDLFMSSF